MAYIPNPDDPTQPTEDKFVESAAAEFRAIKTELRDINETVDEISEFNITRTLRVPDGEAIPDLPNAAARANTQLLFNSEGDPIVGAAIPGSAAGVLLQLGDSADATQGDALIAVRNTGIGAVARTQHDRNQEVVNVKDFGATGLGVVSETAFINAAIDHVALAGGGVVIVPAGIYKLNNVIYLKNNVHLAIEHGAIMDCRTGGATYSVLAEGTYGTEIPLAVDITSGNNVITTTTPHGLVVGDWIFLKSQRPCLHTDAGPKWRLGDTTAGLVGSQPYFGEPHQVMIVNSPTQFTTSGYILFPDYFKDRTRETYVPSGTVRESATIAKITFAVGIKVTGGKWLKSDNGKTLMRLRWCLRPYIDLPEIQMGKTAGVGVFVESCLFGYIKGMAMHDVDWLLGAQDHSAFNDFKDVGCWYCTYDIETWNGSQGFDQSYLSNMHCGIGTEVKIRSFYSHETSGTTHSGIYGIDVDVESFGNHGSGFFNRARFARIRMRCHGENGGASAMLILRGWGGLDTIVHDSHFSNQAYGIDYDPVSDSAEWAPPECNMRIDNCVFTNVSGGPAIYLRERPTATPAVPCNIAITNITARDIQRFMYVGQGWHGGTVDNVSISRMSGTGTRYGIELRTDVAGWRLRNIRGYDLNAAGGNNTLVRWWPIGDSTVKAAFGVAAHLDDASIQLFGSGTKYVNPNVGIHADYMSGGDIFTATYTSLLNATVAATGPINYSVSGGVVTMSGYIAITAPAAGQSRVNISLPLANNFSGVSQAAGCGVSVNNATQRFATIFADVTTEQLTLEWYAGAAESKTFSWIAQYLVQH